MKSDPFDTRHLLAYWWRQWIRKGFCYRCDRQLWRWERPHRHTDTGHPLDHL